MLQAIATRLPTGASITDIEALADTMLARESAQIVRLRDTGPYTSGDVIRRADGMTVEVTGDEPHYTTRALIQTEHAAAAHTAWRTTGIRVTGVALAARAALELQEASGIPSTTLAGLIGPVDRGEPSPLAPGSVLIVDEAGMVGTRTLARLLQHGHQHGAKVVLAGDHRQLPQDRRRWTVPHPD